MLKALKTFPFLSSWLSPFSPRNAAIVMLSDGCTLRILEICYAMTEFVFLHFSIEVLVINFYMNMDCYQKLFYCYQSILGTKTL